MTDPSSHVTTYTYNPANQQIFGHHSTGVRPSPAPTTSTPSGNEVAVTSPVAIPTVLSNTSGCDPVPVTSSTCVLFYTTYKTYNSSGQVLTSTNPDGGRNYQLLRCHVPAIWLPPPVPSGNPATCNPTTSSTPCADTMYYSYNARNQLRARRAEFRSTPCSSPGSHAGIVKYTYTTRRQAALR